MCVWVQVCAPIVPVIVKSKNNEIKKIYRILARAVCALEKNNSLNTRAGRQKEKTKDDEQQWQWARKPELIGQIGKPIN